MPCALTTCLSARNSLKRIKNTTHCIYGLSCRCSFVIEKARACQCQHHSSKQSKMLSRHSDPEHPGESMFHHCVVLIFISDWSSFCDCCPPNPWQVMFQFFPPNTKYGIQRSESSCRSLKPGWRVPSVYSSLNIDTHYAKLCHWWEENSNCSGLNFSSERHSDHWHYSLCQWCTHTCVLNKHFFFPCPLCEQIMMHKEP